MYSSKLIILRHVGLHVAFVCCTVGGGSGSVVSTVGCLLGIDADDGSSDDHSTWEIVSKSMSFS